MTLTHISLFTGYAGFDLALKLAGIEHRTILYVEIEKYCQEIIRQRVRDGFLNDAPIWPDVRTLNGRPLAGKVGLLTAGFPCQPHSIAGRRGGAADERNLWPDTFRLIGEMEPGYVILENVPGILTNRYAGTVVGQLSEIGYDCQWRIVSAAHVGAPHRRERWWCLAANTTKQRLEIDWRKGYSSKWWANASERYFVEMARGTEPFPGNIRIRDDAAHWMDRLKALGNGIVPAVAAEFLSLVDFSLCSSVNSENDYYSNE